MRLFDISRLPCGDDGDEDCGGDRDRGDDDDGITSSCEEMGVCVCVQATRFQGIVVITRYQSLPLPPGQVLPI